MFICIAMPFSNFYNQLAAAFGPDFVQVQLQQGVKTIWPKGRGVYCVWKKEKGSSKRILLYVGKAGKIVKDDQGDAQWNTSVLAHRVNRWTPYRFAERERDGAFQYHFRFGPVHGDQQPQLMYQADAYLASIPYDYIEVDFFVFRDGFVSNGHTPASLETALLTAYLEEFQALPGVNNEL
jgi:hypothetical protein